MTELAPRAPHNRHYVKSGEGDIEITADDHGLCSITEEALDQIIRLAGWTEVTKESA